ncbi:MAG: RsmB/NOP family class I SAM-dependent RNA methyltransferase [Cephaloticoccus sp.]|nr:RsmB/NOP family class I SAM-dependent RNA methyltransferase [Cephaloticoccus sp.]MCF7761444.1 RsmB/NOP family class I SAM-dependent RNA methyltransferase [Cephaloticoccus sp.]
MSVAGNQRQTYLRLVATLRPHWRSDLLLPDRIQKLLAGEKRFGSRDRRLYRELLYTTLRFLPWVDPLWDTDPERAAAIVAWLAADGPATANYRAELSISDPQSPVSLSAKAAFLKLNVADLLPTWFARECPAAFTPAELETLHQRASLWLRLQTGHPEQVTDELSNNGWKWRMTSPLPEAIEISDEVNITACASFRAGAVEVQDLGSQLLLHTTMIKADGRWLDACAGAGGKSLQLARILGLQGKVTAHDIRASALTELQIRAKRAGLRNIVTTGQPPEGTFDGVLVDAPCSGSGTWRRAPHLKWITHPAMVMEYATRQLNLLGQFAAAVRPGGQLIYATCSLNRSENESVIAAFLQNHQDFRIEPPFRDFGYQTSPGGITIMPSRHNTDGFFVASMRRR